MTSTRLCTPNSSSYKIRYGMDAIAALRRVRLESLGWLRIGSKTACASENNTWISSVFMMLMEFNGYFCRINYIGCFCTWSCAQFLIAIFDCNICGAQSLIAIFARFLRSYRCAIFDCGLRANFSSIAIFDCDIRANFCSIVIFV